MGIKNAEFDADLEFVAKVAKQLMQKQLSTMKEKFSFLLLLLCAKVFGLSLFEVNFWHFALLST
jgi:hypothetical protein